MAWDLEGRGAVVTGGGRGIGAAVARALARAGARVAVVARSAGEVEGVAASLRAGGGEAFAIACDVADEPAVLRMSAEATERLEAVDILVHAAGASGSASLARIALDDWNRLLAANATSAFLCARAFVPGMIARGWGRVVVVASVAGLEGGKYIAHYAAAKHAVVGLVRSVAAECAGSGVAVNAVCPGYVDSPMTERTLANVGARTGMSRERALAAVLATTGQERLVTVDEVAAAALALCRAESGAANGTTVVVNGGRGE